MSLSGETLRSVRATCFATRGYHQMRDEASHQLGFSFPHWSKDKCPKGEGCKRTQHSSRGQRTGLRFPLWGAGEADGVEASAARPHAETEREMLLGKDVAGSGLPPPPLPESFYFTNQ